MSILRRGGGDQGDDREDRWGTSGVPQGNKGSNGQLAKEEKESHAANYWTLSLVLRTGNDGEGAEGVGGQEICKYCTNKNVLVYRYMSTIACIPTSQYSIEG